MCRIFDEKLFSRSLQSAAKGTPWTAKQGVISSSLNGWIFSVDFHQKKILRFFAKPVAWDHMLWDILQIEGNQKKPVTFHYWGTFTCKTPAICELCVDEEGLSTDDLAQAIISFADQGKDDRDWQKGLSFEQMHDLASSDMLRQDYTMTQVISLISNQRYEDAKTLCQQAVRGEIPIRHVFSSFDKNEVPDRQGRRPSRSFFELAEIYLEKNLL